MSCLRSTTAKKSIYEWVRVSPRRRGSGQRFSNPKIFPRRMPLAVAARAWRGGRFHASANNHRLPYALMA